MSGSHVIAAVAALGLSACVGNGVGLNINGQALTPDFTAPPPDLFGVSLDLAAQPIAEDASADQRATLGWIQQTIFTPICAQCHAGAAAPKGLKLDAAESRLLLVNVYSDEIKTSDPMSQWLYRVKPGDPDNSYLVIKIEGKDPRPLGQQMPLGGPYLNETQITAIRQWISRGALPDSQ